MSWKERFVNVCYDVSSYLKNNLNVNAFIKSTGEGNYYSRLTTDDTTEELLECHNNLMPIRYSYSEIKSMTKGFKDKLGGGSYGSVFKGKLQSGRLVAIKVLRNSSEEADDDLQDFMNVVSTIGNTHHVNVVQLTGFCAEGSKRALVYEFMPYGSLDKFFFSDHTHRDNNINSTSFLTWDRIYQIAVGVARGIGHIHQASNQKFLLMIKPRDILLDHNFIPKISDFGLAKLYPVDSGACVRFTIGMVGSHIAPEVGMGGAMSYKADVYSFGMLLMEMVGRRKDLNLFLEQRMPGKMYLLSWIYGKLVKEEKLELGNVASEDEKKIARKIIIVALWCIQMKPINRPSMSEVLEMLEGQVELLKIPPESF